VSLSHLEFPIIDADVCLHLWNEKFNDETEFCAGYQSKGKSFCEVCEY